MSGDMTSAREKYKQALKIINAVKNHEMKFGGKTVVSVEAERIDIQIGLARAYFDQQKNLEAKVQAQQALKSFSHDRYPEKAAKIYNLMAGISFRERDLDKALVLAEKCLAVYLSQGFRDGISDTYSNLGILSATNQNYAAAKDYFILALDLHQSLGDVEGIAITHNNLGMLEISRGYLIEAITHLDKSIRNADLSDLFRTLTQSIINKGYALILLGDYEEASAALSEGETLCDRHRFGDLLGEVLWIKSECLIALDDIDAAVETAISAIEPIFRTLQNE